MTIKDQDGLIALGGDSITPNNNIVIRTKAAPDGTLEVYQGIPGNIGNLIFNSSDINGSGRILQVTTNYQAGTTSSTTTYISFSNSTILFTPKSNNSTILVISNFFVETPPITSVNTIAYVRLYELSTGYSGSEYAYRATSSPGGIGFSTGGVNTMSFQNSDKTTKQFQLQGRRYVESSYAITIAAILTTLIEIEN